MIIKIFDAFSCGLCAQYFEEQEPILVDNGAYFTVYFKDYTGKEHDCNYTHSEYSYMTKEKRGNEITMFVTRFNGEAEWLK